MNGNKSFKLSQDLESCCDISLNEEKLLEQINNTITKGKISPSRFNSFKLDGKYLSSKEENIKLN